MDVSTPGNGTPHPEPEPQPKTKKRGGHGMSPEGKLIARRNALKDGLRSIVIYPELMEEFIRARADAFAEQLGPTTELEWYLVDAAAAACTQSQLSAELLLFDTRRVLERAYSCWDDDRRTEVNKLAAQLHERPYQIAQALETTKQGTDFLLHNWECLDELLISNDGWTEPQRELAFDLLGVAHELRDGSRKVPAGQDAPALRALVAREMGRLRDYRESVLVTRDRLAQEGAMLGLLEEEDKASRRLRGKEARAHRRLVWALSSLERLRQGADPASVIDPETKQPPDLKARAAPPPNPAPPTPEANAPDSASSPPPPPPPSPEPTAPSEEEPLPQYPAGCSAEDREMMAIASPQIRAVLAAHYAAVAQHTGLVPPVEPGPPRR